MINKILFILIPLFICLIFTSCDNQQRISIEEKKNKDYFNESHILNIDDLDLKKICDSQIKRLIDDFTNLNFEKE